MKPLVSVIIPVYNNAKTIDKCLASLFKQTLKALEIIVINDASTDNSLEILKRYEAKIILINNRKNYGPAEARNRGLAIAKGKYIGFVDADDYVEEDMYKIMSDAISSDIDLVCCSRYNIKKGIKKEIKNEEQTDNPKDFSRTSSYVWDKLFKKSIIDKYHLTFPTSYHYSEDFAFLMKYKYYARKMKILPIPLYNYLYDSDNSITNSHSRYILDIIAVLEDTINFFKREEQFTAYYDELLILSMQFYLRRIREFKRYHNFSLKRRFVWQFLNYFKKYFPDYKAKLNSYNTPKIKRYRSSYILMLLYIGKSEIRRK